VPRLTAVPHAFVAAPWSTSQPFAELLSQLSKPALQLAIAQLPVLHVAVALLREHPMPQPPQLVVVRVEVSQPLEVTASQLP
jgi:hypothetical protein